MSSWVKSGVWLVEKSHRRVGGLREKESSRAVGASL